MTLTAKQEVRLQLERMECELCDVIFTAQHEIHNRELENKLDKLREDILYLVGKLK